MKVRFEWDPAKAEANIRKHGISFETAMRVFADPFALSEQERVEGHEARWQTIGRIGDQLVVIVAHTVGEEDGEEIEVIRSISARRAERRERRRYEQDPR